MDKKLTKKEIVEILTESVLEDLDKSIEHKLIELNDEAKAVFLKMIKMECHVIINFLAKEISDKKNNIVANPLIKEDIYRNIEPLKKKIVYDALKLNFFKDNEDEESNMNSFHFIKDLLFLDKENLTLLSEVFRSNKYISNEKLKNLMDLCINENKAFQKFVNQNSIFLSDLGCANKIRNPFLRGLNKIKGLDKIITLSNISGLNDKEFVSNIIENKYYLLFTNKNVREFDIVKKSLNRFIVDSCDFYSDLDIEDKKRIVSFLYANKKHAPKGIVEKFIPQFITHWKNLCLIEDKKVLAEFNQLYNEDIKNKGREAATIIKMLKNLNGKEKYSRVKTYNHEDLTVLIDSQILMQSASLNNIEISATTLNDNKEKVINLIVTGDKEIIDIFDFDKYLYSLHDATKNISKENRWNRIEEYTEIVRKTLRTTILQIQLGKSEKTDGINRIKKKV